MQTLDTVTPEQVIEVPKLSQDRIPRRSAVRRPQKAEQLVEVPTDPAHVVLVCASSVLDGNLQGFLPGQSSPASREDLDRLRRAVEQTIPVPVPGRGGGGGRGGLQGSSGQNSTAQVVEQIVDFSVSGGLQGSLPGQISSQRSLEQLVDIPAGGGPQLPDPGASSSSAVSRDKRGEGFFRIFPRKKKVRAGRWKRSAHGRRLLMRTRSPPLMSSSPSCTRACCGCAVGTPIVRGRWGGPGGWTATIVIVCGWPPWE